MTLYFARSVLMFIIAGLAKPGFAEKRKKRRQLDKLSFKEKDDKKRLLHDLFVLGKDKVKELHPRMTAMVETEDLANSERNPRHVGLVVNTEKDSDRVDGGIFDASSRGKLVVSDDVPFQNSRRRIQVSEPNTMESTPKPPSDPKTRKSKEKTKAPTKTPKEKTKAPTKAPTGLPTPVPTSPPTAPPTEPPTGLPTPVPTSLPTPTPCTINNLEELKAAIANAPNIPFGPAPISVCPGTFLFDSTIRLDDKAFDMSCAGPEECIFDGNNTRRLFGAYTSSVDFTMEGFTFQNGVYRFGAGAFYLSDVVGNCSWIDNYFTDNSAGSIGGALILNGRGLRVVMQDNTFNGNRAGSGGGAVVLFSSTFVFKNNNFIDNYAGYCGGALSTYSGTSTFEGNTFKNNTAQNRGGAVCSDYSTNLFKNNNFIDNYAGNIGGALFTYSGTSTLDGNTFKNNTAQIGDNIFNIPTYTCNRTNNFCDGDSVPVGLQTTCGATPTVCPT